MPAASRRPAAVLALVVGLVALATVAGPLAAGASAPTSWRVVPSANAPGLSAEGTTTLSSTSCVSATFCMAVGYSIVGGGDNLRQAITEEGNGTSWSLVPVPNPPDFTTVSLNSVSCTSASFCVAVGTANSSPEAYTSRPFLETWNGTSWALRYANPSLPTPPDAYFALLSSVSCTSSVACVAVGSWIGGTGLPNTYALTLTGTTWSDSTITGPGTQQTLSSVSCSTATECLAVGSWVGSPGGLLAEWWSGGAWTVVAEGQPAPQVSSSSDVLDAVSCYDSVDYVPPQVGCLAVGSTSGGAYGQFWNGTTWTAVTTSSSSIGVSGVDLTAVSCPTTAACTIAGTDAGAGVLATWAGGTSFHIATLQTLNLVFATSALAGMSCLLKVACVAVGDQAKGAATDTLALVGPPPPGGYWLVASDGGLFAFGDAGFYGSAGGTPLKAPVVGMAATPDAGGYWEVGADGGIFNYGDALFYGSTGAITLNKPIVGMLATPDGKGYWLVASDGGIFCFGDAGYYGSTGGITLNKPIVGMATTPDGQGYWLVASDGGIFSFGDALFYGSTGGITLNKPIVGMATGPGGQGYWLVASDGGIFTFGDAQYLGSTGGITLNQPVVGMAATPDGQGYWLVASDGGIFNFGDAPFYGSTGGLTLNKPIVGMAAS